MDILVDIISWICMGAGAFFMFSAGLGILRMPDIYTRSHAAGVGDSFGAPLLLLGLILQHGFTLFSLKIALLILFIWITGSTATHMITKAAMISGVKPWLYNKKGLKKVEE